ncbi:hypothetical protein AG1IA_02795 [Rhizoctonia solani AG-1 IA]|uniref:Large ribosomal subunit protein bL12 C-terminal domain-containing protein n=1 Tax=Thanatephorus cucumeris (strain AG1-IA) TaxID=983506 RepID=L8WYU0_THACA|nr:hypothetical protein AG1IA_02795 [Rhizoctonia solani AG-1 IA]
MCQTGKTKGEDYIQCQVKAIMPNMNLVEAKKFVESVPKTLKENVPKEEAEKLMKTLKDLGATVVLE